MRKSTDMRQRVLPHLSRRDLLRWGALLAGGLMLHGCDPLEIGGEPTATPVPPTRTPTPWPAPTPRPVGPATVALARADSVADAVRHAVEMAEGLDFIESGQTVMIKPNVNSDDPYPATTNPEVVHAVVKLVLEWDPARVIVADRSGPFSPGGSFGDTLAFMRTTGIYQAAMEAGAEVTSFDDGPWIRGVKPAGARNWGQGFSIPQQVVEVDHLINLPVAKTHRIATFTMSLKNWVGLPPPDKRLSPLHARTTTEARLGSLIAELNLVADLTWLFVAYTA